MAYLSHTDRERQEMLAAIGVRNVEELFADIPAELRAPRLDIPGPLTEVELRRELKRIAEGNCDMNCDLFLGAGSYHHFIPAALPHLVKRSEFYTAYTPYQPEISQGMLQAIFEFQTMMCEITGLDVANASMYDGSTALYEAALMAVRCTKLRRKVLVDECVNPLYRRVLETYSGNLDIEMITISHTDGRTNFEAFEELLDDQIAAVVVANPNFFGIVQDYTALFAAAAKVGALSVMSVNPIASPILKSPAEMGADIACGEGQPLGSPMFFGGPYVGFLTTHEKYVRQMPGRIISETKDRDGKRGFVMTLQTREQHIRRAKATSNICTNQGLVALTACVFLSLIGKQGMKEMAVQNLSKADYARHALSAVKGVTVKWQAPTFNEFVISLPGNAEEVLSRLSFDHKVIGGLALGQFYDGMENDVLVCATEMNTRAQIDNYANVLGRTLWS